MLSKMLQRNNVDVSSPNDGDLAKDKANAAAAPLICPMHFQPRCSSEQDIVASPKVMWAPYDHRLLTTTSTSVSALVAHPREVVTAAWQGSNVPAAAVRNKSFICNCMRPR